MKRIYRSRKDHRIGGVCGGMGEYFEIDPVLIRVIWVAAIILAGAGIVAYIIAWAVIPLQPEQEETDKPDKQTAPTPVNKPSLEERRKSRRVVSGLIIITIGVLFLVNNLFSYWDFEKFWPLILIVLGIAILIMEPRKER
ncbi:MAG: PspC domain-containing protein [bacterium]|nr:PspC domain-containing protein [bacterium]